jgi:hypothetical protein
MHLALQMLRWSVGALLYLGAILFYENEEKKVQNRLEELWIWAVDRKDAELSRAARFLQGVARLTNRAFDSLLGNSLWSFQAVGVSLWFSLASLWVTPLVLSHLPKATPAQHGVPFHLGFLFITCALFGMLPLLVGRLWAFVAWTLAASIFLFRWAGFAVFGVQTYGYAPVLRVLAVLLLILLFSLGFDVLYISITRWMLRRMLQIRPLHELIGLIVLDVTLAIVLVDGPIEMSSAMLKSASLEKASVAVLLLVMFNFGDFIACSVFFVVMLAILAHRLMWPIVERHIYALQRFGLIRKKWLLLTIASLLWFGPKGIEFVKFAMQFAH